MDVQVDQLSAVRVEAHVILDARVAVEWLHDKALDARLAEYPRERQRGLSVDEQIEVRRSNHRGAQVLVALPVAVHDVFGVEPSEETREHTERCRLHHEQFPHRASPATSFAPSA